MKVLIINTSERAGGAAVASRRLKDALSNNGLKARMLVAHKETPDFITFLRHHMAHIENQLITSNNWVVLGGASEKHVPL